MSSTTNGEPANNTLDGGPANGSLDPVDGGEKRTESSLDDSDVPTVQNQGKGDPNGPKRPQGEPLPATKAKTCSCRRDGKNLVVCIDGTSNQFGFTNTNVIELYSLIKKETGKDVKNPQCTWYNSGIGTYARPSWKSWSYYKQVINHKIDLAIAWNFENIILDAYRWLSETYEDGDCIFLFGFSRGAYQVRTLSAMIDKVGLIHRGNEKQIPFAYQLYADSDRVSKSSEKAQTYPEPQKPRVDLFKATFSRVGVKVHFVGAWDTVSSVGVVRGSKLLPGTTDGMQHVCVFRHALALDERRVKFLPEYAYGGVSQLDVPDTEEMNDTKEVWFAGTHSDIGGGNDRNANLDKVHPPLRWMYSEASTAGLHLKPFESKVEAVEVKESLTGIWWLLELLPFRRPTYASKGDKKHRETSFWPHLGGVRVIQKGQKFHPSVWLSDDLGKGYIPRARLNGYKLDEASERGAAFSVTDSATPLSPSTSQTHLFWLKLQGKEKPNPDGTLSNPWKEVDLYDLRGNLVWSYTKLPSADSKNDDQRTMLNTMRIQANSGEGWRELSTEIVKRLGDSEAGNTHPDILCNVLDILNKSSGVRSKSSTGWRYRRIRSMMLRHIDRKEITASQAEIAQRFLTDFTDLNVQVLDDHSWGVFAVAFAMNGSRVVSVSGNGRIISWDVDAETREENVAVDVTFEGRVSWIHSVALSPDGKYAVSAVKDPDIETAPEPANDTDMPIPDKPMSIPMCVWDVETGHRVGKLFTVEVSDGNPDVNSIALSPDGKWVASSSDDYVVRLWDREAGVQCPMVGKDIGHSRRVYSLAFSSDSKRLASGSGDCSIRIWDVEEKKPLKVLSGGHTDDVNAVAFSPNGKRVVSGSDDGTTRVWDVETATPQVLGNPFVGSGSPVYSVTFSPDGKRVASGSLDGSISIWDVKTGKRVGRSLEAHTDAVYSIVFSPDGERIVSCSSDTSVRVWDVLQDPL